MSGPASVGGVLWGAGGGSSSRQGTEASTSARPDGDDAVSEAEVEVEVVVVANDEDDDAGGGVRDEDEDEWERSASGSVAGSAAGSESGRTPTERERIMTELDSMRKTNPRGKLKRMHSFQNEIDFEESKMETTEVLRALERKRRQAFYREFFTYCLFVGVFLRFAGTLPTEIAFQPDAAVWDLFLDEEFPTVTFKKTFFDVKTRDELYEWLEGPFVNGWYERDLFEGEDPLLADRVLFHLVPLGQPQLRQIRIRDEACDGELDGFFRRCVTAFTSTSRETEPFSRGNTTYEYTPSGLSELFASNLLVVSYKGSKEVSYGHGGYLVRLPNSDRAAAAAQIAELRADDWIDEYTRAVAVDWSFYNPNLNLFTTVQTLFQFLPTGYLEVAPRIYSYRLITFGRMIESSSSALYITAALFVLYYIIAEYREMMYLGPTRYAQNFWNLFEFVFFAFVAYFFSSMLLFVLQASQTMENKVKPALRDPERYVDLGREARLASETTSVASIAVLFCLVRLLKYLRVNARMNAIWRTLRLALWDLLALIVIFICVFSGYAIFAHYIFGHLLFEFASFEAAMSSGFQMLLGNFSYEDMRMANPALAFPFFSSFMIVIFFVLLQIFIIVLNGRYEEARLPQRNEGDLNEIEYDPILLLRDFFDRHRLVVSLREGTKKITLESSRTLEVTTGANARRLNKEELAQANAAEAFAPERRASISAHVEEDLSHRIGIDVRNNPEGLFAMRVLSLVRPKDVLEIKSDNLIDPPVDLRVREVRRINNQPTLQCRISGEAQFKYGIKHGDQLRISVWLWRRYITDMAMRSIVTFPARLRAFLCHTRPDRIIRDEDLYKMIVLLRADQTKDASYWVLFEDMRREIELFLRTKQTHKITTELINDVTEGIFERFRWATTELEDDERDSHNYNPPQRPLNVAFVQNFQPVIEALAANSHKEWALRKVNSGFVYGKVKNSQANPPTHDMLLPYARAREVFGDDFISQNEDPIRSQLSIIADAGYTVTSRKRAISTSGGNDSPGASTVHLELQEDTTKPYGPENAPRPIDTGSIALSPALTRLTRQMAEAAHDMWARHQMEQGFRWGLYHRDDLDVKTNPRLIPFHRLDETERIDGIEGAAKLIKLLLALGFRISSSKKFGSLARKVGMKQ